jgi:hypothetical protein
LPTIIIFFREKTIPVYSGEYGYRSVIGPAGPEKEWV